MRSGVARDNFPNATVALFSCRLDGQTPEKRVCQRCESTEAQPLVLEREGREGQWEGRKERKKEKKRKA